MTPAILAHLKLLAAAFDPDFPPEARPACHAAARAIKAAMTTEERARLDRFTASTQPPASAEDAELARTLWQLYRVAAQNAPAIPAPGGAD